MREEGISRRDFLKDTTVFFASSAAGLSGTMLPPRGLENFLAGAADIEQATMAAFTDTIIPGPASDPEGSVGGVEASALEVLYDPYYGLKPFIGIVHLDLNLTSLWMYKRLFKALDLSRRTKIVLLKESKSRVRYIYELAELLVKLAFYGAIVNDIGTDYISFPGPSNGYHDYSFNKKFAEEATEDGNPP